MGTWLFIFSLKTANIELFGRRSVQSNVGSLESTQLSQHFLHWSFEGREHSFLFFKSHDDGAWCFCFVYCLDIVFSTLSKVLKFFHGIFLMFVPPRDQADLLFGQEIPFLWAHRKWADIGYIPHCHLLSLRIRGSVAEYCIRGECGTQNQMPPTVYIALEPVHDSSLTYHIIIVVGCLCTLNSLYCLEN